MSSLAPIQIPYIANSSATDNSAALLAAVGAFTTGVEFQKETDLQAVCPVVCAHKRAQAYFFSQIFACTLQLSKYITSDTDTRHRFGALSFLGSSLSNGSSANVSNALSYVIYNNGTEYSVIPALFNMISNAVLSVRVVCVCAFTHTHTHKSFPALSRASTQTETHTHSLTPTHAHTLSSVSLLQRSCSR